MKTRTRLGLALAIAMLAPVAIQAEMSKADKKEAKRMMDGTLYLRLDAPCATGRHSWGTYKRPLVEVSPTGTNVDTDDVMTASWWHADSTYWSVLINDAVKVDEMDFDDDEVEFELEGKGDEDKQTAIKFVNIRSLDDFEKAFDQTFSTVPLQDEHPDWSSEIREAIGNRELVPGMTKRQAYYVVGKPESHRMFEEDGKEIEVWMLRQSKGMKMGYWRWKREEESGMPSQLRFEDGQLADIGGSSGGELKLD